MNIGSLFLLFLLSSLRGEPLLVDTVLLVPLFLKFVSDGIGQLLFFFLFSAILFLRHFNFVRRDALLVIGRVLVCLEYLEPLVCGRRFLQNPMLIAHFTLTFFRSSSFLSLASSAFFAFASILSCLSLIKISLSTNFQIAASVGFLSSS